MHPEKPPAFFLYGFTLINPQMSCIKRGPIGLKMGHFNSFMLTYSLACTALLLHFIIIITNIDNFLTYDLSISPHSILCLLKKMENVASGPP